MEVRQSPQPHPITPTMAKRAANDSKHSSVTQPSKPNQVSTVMLYGIPIVCLFIESQERLCLAQISNTLLKQFSYNEIHNRRVALGITCVQCTPVQLEILRRAGAMPVSSRRCGMITRREAERLCKSFLGDNAPPRLPDDFAFSVFHECAWGCRGSFLPARYNSSRAKCIKCSYCGLFFSPNKFIFHSHRLGPNDKYVQPDAANFNSWRRHMRLLGNPPDEITHAWEDVKAMFNGGTRKRMISSASSPHCISSPPQKKSKEDSAPLLTTAAVAAAAAQFPIRPVLHAAVATAAVANNNTPGGGGTGGNRLPNFPADLSLPFPRWMDYMWHSQAKPNSFQFAPYALPWLKRPLAFNSAAQGGENMAASPTAGATVPNDAKGMPSFNCSAFKPVVNGAAKNSSTGTTYISDDDQGSMDADERKQAIKESMSSDDEMVDIETTEDDLEPQNLKHIIDLEKKRASISPERPKEWKKTDSPKLLPKYDGNSNNMTSLNVSPPPHGEPTAVITAPTSIDLVLEKSVSSPSSHSPRSTASPPSLLPSSVVIAVGTGSSHNVTNPGNNQGTTTPLMTTGNGTGELWSVARLSLDRPVDAVNHQQHHHHHHNQPPLQLQHHLHHRLPFYRSDLTKHFQTFARHGETPHPHTIV